MNLGDVLSRWYDHSGDPADLDESIVAVRRALALLPAGATSPGRNTRCDGAQTAPLPT